MIKTRNNWYILCMLVLLGLIVGFQPVRSAQAVSKLYWTDSSAKTVTSSELDGSGVQTPVSGLSRPAKIAVDVTNNKIYWVDNGASKIRRADSDGNNPNDVVTGLSNPSGIGLDVPNGKVYWTEASAVGSGKIRRADMNGTIPTNVPEDIVIGQNFPLDVAVDSSGGYIYWTDNGSPDSWIKRDTLSGSGSPQTLVTLPGAAPDGIDLDLDSVNKKIYWVEAMTQKIQQANLDGTGVLLNFITGLSTPTDVTLDPQNDTMYWTTVGATPITPKIRKATLSGLSPADVVTTGLSFPYGIALLPDIIAPGLTSFTRQTPASSPTNADTLVFRATFDEDVQNVDAADFTVTGTTATVTNVSVVTANSVFDVTVSGGDLAGLNGTVGLDLAGGQNITDAAGNALPTVEPGTDETYTLDNDAPGLTSFTRQTPASSPTNADTLVFRATFDEDVQDVDAADFTATGTTATITAVNPATASVYDVTVSGGDLAGLNGTVGLDLAGGQNITDMVGNALPTVEPGTDETYTLDNDAPGLSSFTRQTPASSPTNADTLVFRATFDEDVQNVDAADFTATGTTATIAAVNPVNASLYDVTVSGGDLAGLNGTVGLDLVGGQDITDMVANALPTVEPGTDETYTIDNTVPTVTIEQAAAQTDPTNASPVSFTVTFSEPVTGFDPTDVDLSSSTTPGTLSAAVSGSGPTYTVDVSGMTGDGDVIATVQANAAQDAAGNDSAASTSTDNQITYDVTAPTTTLTATPSDPTSNTDASFEFSGDDGNGSGVASYACQLDGGGWSACTSPQPYTGLADGSHTFEVRATDMLGQTETPPASYTWTINAPEINISDYPSGTEVANHSTYVVAAEMPAQVVKIMQFRIANTGTQALELTTPVQIGGSHAANLTVLQQPGSPVAPGQTTDMVLLFTSAGDEPQEATVTIPNIDPDESPFVFTLVVNQPVHYLLWTK